MYKRIFTHNDFDGIVSAAVCSQVLNIDYIVFTGPRAVSEARVSITTEDVVCDLPYPLECGMWFDHHEGNLEELVARHIDPTTVAGRFEPRDSCARVVYEYFRNENLPGHFAEMVDEADIIDSFNYRSIAEWRTPTPGKIIDNAVKLQCEDQEAKRQFMRSLIGLLKERPIADVSAAPSIQKRYKTFLEEEKQMVERVRQDLYYLDQDVDKKVMIVDLTHHKRRPNVLKHLAYLLHPESLAVLEVRQVFNKEIRTNDLAFSMSLSLNLNGIKHGKDLGDLMRQLNIGSGHPGAAAGQVACRSKDESVAMKTKMLNKIYQMFCEQNKNSV
jgi:oligoribonuclease NrnB/cAMP/cGMP phosphodiesterase (DHH superfamily)